MSKYVEWAPPWAPRVSGRYTEREPSGDGGYEEQVVEASCAECGESFRRKCASGMVRQHIATFASLHRHRSPLEKASS